MGSWCGDSPGIPRGSKGQCDSALHDDQTPGEDVVERLFLLRPACHHVSDEQNQSREENPREQETQREAKAAWFRFTHFSPQRHPRRDGK